MPRKRARLADFKLDFRVVGRRVVRWKCLPGATGAHRAAPATQPALAARDQPRPSASRQACHEPPLPRSVRWKCPPPRTRAPHAHACSHVCSLLLPCLAFCYLCSGLLLCFRPVLVIYPRQCRRRSLRANESSGRPPPPRACSPQTGQCSGTWSQLVAVFLLRQRDQQAKRTNRRAGPSAKTMVRRGGC